MATKLRSMEDRIEKTADLGVGLQERIAQPDVGSSRFARAEELLTARPSLHFPANPTSVEGEQSAQKHDGEEYRIVSVDDILPNPYNARKHYDPEKLAKFTVSMKVDGQIVPGVATIIDGKVVLIGGFYRLQALKAAGIKTMKLLIREYVGDRDMYELSYKENADRHAQTPLDNASAWSNLLEKKVYPSDADIALSLGISRATVSKTLALLKLDSSILEVVHGDSGQFGISMLYELMLLQEAGGAECALKMAKKVLEEGVARADISREREKFQQQKTRKVTETSRKYRLEFGGSEVGDLREWDSGRVLMDLKIADPEARRAVMKAITDVLAAQGGSEV